MRKRVVLKSGVSVRITALVAIAFVAHAAAAQVTLGPPSLTTPGADEWYLRVPDSVTLYVREFGTGEPVIVLHGGWGMDHGYMLPASADSRPSGTSSFTTSAGPCDRRRRWPRSPCKST